MSNRWWLQGDGMSLPLDGGWYSLVYLPADGADRLGRTRGGRVRLTIKMAKAPPQWSEFLDHHRGQPIELCSQRRDGSTPTVMQLDGRLDGQVMEFGQYLDYEDATS